MPAILFIRRLYIGWHLFAIHCCDIYIRYLKAIILRYFLKVKVIRLKSLIYFRDKYELLWNAKKKFPIFYLGDQLKSLHSFNSLAVREELKMCVIKSNIHYKSNILFLNILTYSSFLMSRNLKFSKWWKYTNVYNYTLNRDYAFLKPLRICCNKKVNIR